MKLMMIQNSPKTDTSSGCVSCVHVFFTCILMVCACVYAYESVCVSEYEREKMCAQMCKCVCVCV